MSPRTFRGVIAGAVAVVGAAFALAVPTSIPRDPAWEQVLVKLSGVRLASGYVVQVLSPRRGDWTASEFEVWKPGYRTLRKTLNRAADGETLNLTYEGSPSESQVMAWWPNGTHEISPSDAEQSACLDGFFGKDVAGDDLFVLRHYDTVFACVRAEAFQVKGPNGMQEFLYYRKVDGMPLGIALWRDTAHLVEMDVYENVRINPKGLSQIRKDIL